MLDSPIKKSMKLLSISFLLCFILSCKTIEEIIEADHEYSKTYDPCNDLKRQIASSSYGESLDNVIFKMIQGPPEDAYGVDIGTIMERKRQQKLKEQLSRQSFLIQKYKAICK